MIRFFLAMLMVFALAQGASAQVQQARGKASVTYTGWSLSAGDKAKAQADAQMKALEFYYAEAGETEASNFDAVREKVKASPERYFLETTVLSEEDDSKAKRYTVAVRVSLNVANLRNAVKANSAVAQGGRAARSSLAFLFVSRAPDSVKSYDDRVYRRVDQSMKADAKSSDTTSSTEGEKVGRGRVSTDASTKREANAQANRSYSQETGGSTTRKASETTWRLIPSANLASIFTSTIAKAGYKVNEASMVEPYAGGHFKVADVEEDYKSGNDLKPATLQGFVAGMRTAQMQYVALGTLDVGVATQDPASGLARVAVTVNAKVLDIGQTIPESIAVVGPVQYSGVAPTEDEARTSALRQAAENASREISAQLTALGVR